MAKRNVLIERQEEVGRVIFVENHFVIPMNVRLHIDVLIKIGDISSKIMERMPLNQMIALEV